MGLRNSRPLPQANAELEMAPLFKRRFRTWHLDHVALVMERYRALTTRHCVDAIQLSAILGIKDHAFIQEIMRLFQPKTPTRVHHMVDAMEIVVVLILVCQAPSMKLRFEAIFDVIDLNAQGVITPADMVVLFGAFARAVMKLFCYAVEPDQRAAMLYINTVLESGIASSGSIERTALSKLMLTDKYAVHYTKQCTGEAKHKLYFLMEKDTEFLGAIEFHTESEMKAASLKTIREMAKMQLYHVPKDFSFLCQGREVKSVWEVDRKGWSIVPFAMRGSPGLRVQAVARNRRTECPRRTNPFEFRYMGNTLARYKKKVSEISPVYRHRGFKIAAETGGKPLASVVKWRVAENWSGEWVYDQPKLAATTKSLLQKQLRNAKRAKAERVAVKTHRGELISPWGATDELVSESRPGTSVVANQQTAMVATPPALNTPAAIAQKKLDREAREKKIKWKSRVIAMDALQQSDVEPQDLDAVDDKENEPRRANRTASVDKSLRKPEAKGSTVLIHVQEGRKGQPSRLLQAPTVSSNDKAPPSLRVQVISQKLELRTPSTLSSGDISLGPFLTSSNIELEEDEVEVFPVIVIRPHGDLVEIKSPADEEVPEHSEGETRSSTERVKLWADSSFLSEYEFDVSRTESNFEHIYHHIYETSMDLITLNRRDVFGRTMLHDAAEHGHSNLMELLLKQCVLRNIGDCRGDTPLHHAARRGRLKEVSALLREQAAPWQLNNEGKSPLFSALEAAAKRLHHSAVSHKRPPLRWKASSVVDASMTSTGDQAKNFLATSDSYPRMRQVIDLLWDRYPTQVLMQPDNYDRTNCLMLEQQVFGDLFQACRDGNLIRVQRLIDLEKRAPPQYVNEQLDTLWRTILHEATEQGHTAVVDLLLKVGADGYIADQRQQLPLHIAAEKGHERITKCLLSKFPGSVQAQDCAGKTPLHLATERNHTAVVVALIATIKELWPAVLDSQDANGYTALHYAAIHGNLKVCRALIDAGAAPTVSRFETTVDGSRQHCLGLFWKKPKDKLGFAADYTVAFDVDSPAELLLRSCRSSTVRGYQERLQILRLLVPLDSSHWVKRTPQMLYHLAVDLATSNLSFAVDVCKTLSDVKYEVNLVHHETFDSALLMECKRVCRHKVAVAETVRDADPSELALVRTLIQIGANVNLPNESNGETPLACAAWHGHLALLDLLLDAGADCQSFPRNSFSSLHFAALGGHVACSKLLLGHEADVNTHRLTPKQDEAPLFFAIRSKSETMVTLLLERGADPCALCTLQQGVTTSFGVRLTIGSEKRLSQTNAMQRMPTFGPGKELIDDGVVGIASPLSFTLLLAKELHAFASSAETTGIARAQRRRDWDAMRQIAMTVAQHAIATITPNGSAGSSLITRSDVYLACVLGYWELAKLLLAQQVMLPNAPTSSKMNSLHLAAAAGQTSVVIALVAAGANVNCRVDQGPLYWSQERKISSKHKLELVGERNRGALYFALINGHVETAAKLLVLGANPLDSLPHIVVVRHRVAPPIPEGSQEAESEITQQHVKLCVHESMPRQLKGVFFEGTPRLRVSESATSQDYHHDRVANNFVTHLECSINAQVPLLHYAAGMGYTSVVKLLVEAGMSMTARRVSYIDGQQPSECRHEWVADTAIHVAILCGHLAVVRYFASQAQYNFPRHFLREGKKPDSLLVTACLTKRVDILNYLLSGGSADEDGGGYNLHDTHDDVQSALNCCAREHFVDGFMLLLRERARPDLSTLVGVVENINWTETPRKVWSGSVDLGQLPPESNTVRFSYFIRLRTRDNRRLLSDAMLLLDAIAQPAKNFDQFFNVLAFDHLLTVFIVCSQYELWRVFHEVFLVNEPHFAEPLNPWRPLLVRAASCCMVLHRAAKANQDLILRFFLRLGVPADLRLSEIPNLSPPIRFAAEHGALQAFLALALKSTNLADAVGIRGPLPQIHFRTIASSTSWFSSTTTRRWQNMSAMSCYDVSKGRSNAHFVHKIVQLLIYEDKHPMGNTLVHLACSRGDPVLVELLLTAGASDLLLVENSARVTPLMAAASRKDAFAATIVRLLVAAGQTQNAPDSIKQRWVSRALVACYSQPAPCNLRVAKILLAADADVDFEDELTQSSAMRCALRTVQFAAVKLLLDHGAKLSLSLLETFLAPFQVQADNLRSHWKTFGSYLKTRGARLLEVESLMTLLLEKKFVVSCWNENLLHQVLTAAAAIAATTAKRSEQEKKFWTICQRIVEQHGDAIASRKTVWGHKSALHYAVQSLEVGIVQQLVETCAFDVDAEDESKRTPLHLVAMNGDAAICCLLLDKLRDKTRIDCVDIQGRTPLHVAVIHGHEAVVAQLLRAGASLAVRCHRGLNAHLYAATLNHVAILMALFERDQSRGLMYSSSGEFAVFLAARSAAFRVVRWFETVYEAIEPDTPSETHVAFYQLTCLQHQRTLLHYAATYGDLDTVKRILSLALASSEINRRDNAGYTPLMYAFAFGKLSVVELLLEAGADPDLTVDHSGEAKTHPYACSFSLATFSKWVALPGWFSFVASKFAPQDKRCLTAAFLTEEHYLLASGYRRLRVKPPVVVGRYSRLVPTSAESSVVRSTLRTWQFPRVSLFSFACEVGDQNLLALVSRLPLPGLVSTGTSSYAVLRRAFLQAVQWNRVETVKLLLSDDAKSIVRSANANTTSNVQFCDFLEEAVDRAVSRGLQEMTILLLSHWRGIKENGRTGADANAFAFQFAQVFQVACIRNLVDVVRYMITRGGDHIVAFHWNEGPSLVYAFAFGHTQLASLLLEHGAHISTMESYVAPSFKKWIEFGCPTQVQVQWYELSAARLALQQADASQAPAFIGPLEVYAPHDERLDREMMAELFLPESRTVEQEGVDAATTEDVTLTVE